MTIRHRAASLTLHDEKSRGTALDPAKGNAFGTHFLHKKGSRGNVPGGVRGGAPLE